MYDSGRRERDFIDKLEGLAAPERQGRAVLAALRRGVGKAPGAVTEMSRYVVPSTQRLSLEREDDYFLIAALFAFSYQRKEERPPWPADIGAGSFGASCAWLAREEAKKRGSTEMTPSLERRFVALLACRPEHLPDHLRHVVSLLRAHNVLVDWAELLRDIQRWQREDRLVQRRWARDFWRAPDVTTTELTTSAQED